MSAMTKPAQPQDNEPVFIMSRVLDAPRDQWKVHLEAREQYVLSDDLIPTGEKRANSFHDPQPLEGTQLDNVFGALVREGDGRAHPRVRVEQAAGQQPLAEAAKARRASSDRRGREPCRALVFHKGDQTVSINVVDERAIAEMPLERRYVALVGANRVR